MREVSPAACRRVPGVGRGMKNPAHKRQLEGMAAHGKCSLLDVNNNFRRKANYSKNNM
jgi:hypothetical protein